MTAPILVVYAVAADTPRHRAIERAIPALIATDQRWLHAQTGHRLNVTRKVRFVRLAEDSATLAALGAWAEQAIARETPPHSVVIYDGANATNCGAGTTIAAVFLQGIDQRTGFPCWAGYAYAFDPDRAVGMGLAEFTVLHELGHTFGLGHTADCHDLMSGVPWCWPVRLSPDARTAFAPYLVAA